MSTDVLAFLLIILMFVIIYALKYFIRAGVNKAGDAVDNAMRQKKSEEKPSETQNLADRFKK
jgi:hypothetical protein